MGEEEEVRKKETKKKRSQCEMAFSHFIVQLMLFICVFEGEFVFALVNF